MDRKIESTSRKRVESLLDERTIDSLRDSLRRIDLSISGKNVTGELLLDPLLQPAFLLEDLYRQSKDVLSHELGAVALFRSNLANLYSRFPELHGGAKRLSDVSKIIPAPPDGGSPCTLLKTGKLAPIYMAVMQISRPDTSEIKENLDVIAGLSQMHGHVEILYDALVHGGVSRLQEEIEWQTHIGGFRSALDLLGGSGKAPDSFLPGWDPLPPIFPRMTPCELLRMGCESMLEEALHGNYVPQAPPLTDIVYSNGIDYIEALGKCAGDKIILHGNFPPRQPELVDVVVRVLTADVEGCVTVEVDKWTKKRIELTLPEGVRSGTIGFRNSGLLKDYNRKMDDVNRRLNLFAAGSRCLGMPVDDFPIFESLLNPCPELTEFNFLVAGLPIIHIYRGPAQVEPDTEIVLYWDVENSDTIILKRVSPDGPLFDGQESVTDPPGNLWNLGASNHGAPSTWNPLPTYEYELLAKNECGEVTQQVEIKAISKTPKLAVHAIEVTQGIQHMFQEDENDNSLPLVAQKETIVRVYVSSDRDGYYNDRSTITGALHVQDDQGVYRALNPSNDSIIARHVGGIEATRNNESTTLNFRIPAAWCLGAPEIEARIVWIEDDRTLISLGAERTVVEYGYEQVLWFPKGPLPVRYVPVKAGTHRAPTARECMRTILRAFDLLPFEPSDIQTWGMGDYESSHDGEKGRSQFWLLSGLDERHKSFELLNDVPDTFWIGITNNRIDGLSAMGPFQSGTTAVVTRFRESDGQNGYNRTNAAHEIGHLLGHGHVKTRGDEGCFWMSCEDAPNKGRLRNPPFDPHFNQVITGPVWDVMGYGMPRWVSEHHWPFFWRL